MWGRKKPAAAPAPVQPAPNGNAVGVNLPPDSRPAQVRHVARMVRLHDAIAKASRKGDAARIRELEKEIKRRRMALYGAGRIVPETRDELAAYYDRLLRGEV